MLLLVNRMVRLENLEVSLGYPTVSQKHLAVLL